MELAGRDPAISSVRPRQPPRDVDMSEVRMITVLEVRDKLWRVAGDGSGKGWRLRNAQGA
jgi:hypothetical protein